MIRFAKFPLRGFATLTTNLILKSMADLKNLTTLDVLGQLCPWPLVLTKQALKAVLCGAELCILTDDPLAELDIRALCERNGHAFLSSVPAPGSNAFAIHIRKKC